MRKRRIQKTIVLITMTSLLFTATACRNDNSENTNDSATQEAVTDNTTEMTDSISARQNSLPDTSADNDTEESTEESKEVTSQTVENNPVQSNGSGSNISSENNKGALQTNNSSNGNNTVTSSDFSGYADASQDIQSDGQTAGHTHTWVAVTQQVWHEEEGHYENVLIAPEYQNPIQETHCICHHCGFDYSANNWNPSNMAGHVCPDGTGGATYGGQTVIVGYKTEPAIYEEKWIVDKPGYYETVTTGYQCSTCGAAK